MAIHSLMLLAVLMLPAQRWTAHVSGRILDREGKPLVNAQITYKQIGQFTNGGAMVSILNPSPDPTGTGIRQGGNGRVYKAKTGKNGEFELIGVAYGEYAIEIADSSGKRIFRTNRLVGDNENQKNISNVLDVDLSSAVPAPGGINLTTDKLNKEQLALVREENANAAKINRLIRALRGTLDAQNWPLSLDLLQQLLAVNPNRWEFYQNLGAIYINSGRYQEAIPAFEKGVEVAQRTLANAPDQDQAKTDISNMMISEGDAYLRLDKLEEAVALYNKAAAIAPSPGVAYFHACNAQANRSTAEAAMAVCHRAITADPDLWESYQVLGSLENGSEKPADALATYERGVEAARKELTSNPSSVHVKYGMGQMLNAAGDLYSKGKRYDQAIAAFAESAKLSAYAALPYLNLCATYYNVKRLPDAVTACDQAIASDPTMADAYFLKASALFAQGVPAQAHDASAPETRAMLHKYLEVAPNGRYASAAREMLYKLDSPR